MFYKSKDDIGAETGLDYMQERDPFEPEAKEAEARANGILDEEQNEDPSNLPVTGEPDDIS